MAWCDRINTTSACYAENSKSGIMICGINWGGSADDAPNSEKASFFSDKNVNNFRYRNRVVYWFELFGHKLNNEIDNCTDFERSIIQTNWLSTQSPNIKNQSIYDECINEWDNFEFHLKTLEPKVIIFLSLKLLEALNSPECIAKASRVLGDSEAPARYKKTIICKDKELKSFYIATQKFKNTNIIALPHPTGSVGLSNEYIEAFKPEIYPIIQDYKIERNFIS